MGGPETECLSASPPPQDTVIALDALSAYWIASHTLEERALNVTLSSMGRSGFKSHELQLNNHQIQGMEEELQVSHSFTWLASPTPEPPVARLEANPASPHPCGIPMASLLDVLVGRPICHVTWRKSPNL